MISLIICSRQPDIPQLLKDNIAETIGVEYELVVIDNSKNQFSIFQAYNEGVCRARYPYLCFMHEDILFHTQNWGKNVVEHFKDEKVGLIGVAGGHYMADCPSSWNSTLVYSENYLMSSIENGLKETTHFNRLSYFNGLSVEVVAVDGVWFCTPKSLFKKAKFDDQTFKGFHCYDLDICFQVRNTGHKVLVVSDVLIEHFSGGNWNIEWFENLLLFFNKWKECLPQIVGVELTSEDMAIREEFVREKFELLNHLFKSQSEIIRIRQSKAYRLGKFILRPLNFIRNIFNPKNASNYK